MKKILLISLLLIVGGLAFFKYQYEPEQANRKAIEFVESFLTNLEKNGTDFISRDFLFSDMDAKPIVSWEEYYSKNNISNNKEEYFKIWKDVYLNNVKDYFEIPIDYPTITVMTYEDFKDVYKNFDFYNFNLQNSEYSFDEIECFGYVNLKNKNSRFRISQLLDNIKFTVTAKNGSNGWKILFFLLDIN